MIKNFLQSAYHQILEEERFELLDSYRNPESWHNLDQNDRELLAKLFTLQGEKLLSNGESGLILPFELAHQICPQHIELLLRQAVAYATHGKSVDNLYKACDIAEYVLQLKPSHFPALTIYANTLVELGLRTDNPDYFIQAEEKYIEAASSSQDSLEANFFWHWGICLQYIAKHSGEATDFVRAIQQYQKADELKLTGALFWNDYANALVDLGCLVDRIDHFLRASEIYQKVVESEPALFEGWFNLACTDMRLWEINGEEKYFYSAHKSFEQAALINDNNAQLWLKWATLLYETGKNKSSQKLIEASLDKFLKANSIRPDHPLTLSRFAEAQTLLASMTERLDYLKWSEMMINRVIDIEGENPRNWLILGRIYIELGRYFEERDYFDKALEKFKFGLSLNKSDPELWQGMALSYHLLGRLLDSAEYIEKAIKFYSRVIEFNSEMDPDFWNEWGVAMMKMGEISQDWRWIEVAGEKFEHAIKFFHLHPQKYVISADWFYNWGAALDILGDHADDEKHYEKAIRALSQAILIDPDHIPAKFQLASAFTHLGQTVHEVDCFQRAHEIFQEIAELDPEDELIWLEWGISLMHLAELIHDPIQTHYTEKLIKEAEEKLYRSLTLGNPQSYYFLACVSSWKENFSQALLYLEKAYTLKALPFIDDLLHDEWLKDLRQTPLFQQFIQKITPPRS